MQNSSVINLESILSLGAKLNESLDINFIFSSALLSLMGKLLLKKGCGFIRSQNSFKQVICKGTNEEVSISSLDFENNQYLILKKNSYLYQKGFQLALILKSQNEIIGLILLGHRVIDKELSEDEIKYIQIVGSITSTALSNTIYFNQLKQERDTIQKQNLLLRTLIDISNDFKNITSREHILKLFSLYLKGNLRINRQAIFLINEKNVFQLVNDFGDLITEKDVINLFEFPQITYRDNLPEEIKIHLTTAVSIIAPLIYQGEKKGILLIGKRLDHTQFLEENLTFIELLGNALITALENNRLFLEELDKEKLERELDLAREIQNNLLPKSNPIIDGWDIVGKSIPSKTVGGDYFDFVELSENEYLFIIADISGKGIPAALLMSNLQASIRTLTELNLTLDEIVRKVNSLLYRNTSFDKFATLFIAKLNTSTANLEYINAGHNPPLYLKSDATYCELSQGCLLLGVVEDLGKIETASIQLQQNEIVLMFTDGISESMNSNYQEYGIAKLIDNLKTFINLQSNIILEKIYSDIKLFTAGMEQYDDMTAIIIKRN